MVDLQNVRKRFGAHTAVDGIELHCETGRTQALIGPSGCGKSTLLRMMVGLVAPDEGDVVFDGQRLGKANITEVRRRIGYVIQEGGLFPHLTARENSTIMPRFLGWTIEKTDAKVAELLKLVHLTSALLERYPRQLSGGQRQRISLMRALMLDPDVLLLDEPLGDLDPMIRAELQEDLRAIFRELGKTVVLVTHDLTEAGFLGDRITLLSDGRIVQQGSLEDLTDAPANDFVARFVRAQRRLVG
jgi:osmoprotectant transport system ATP-binding protein